MDVAGQLSRLSERLIPARLAADLEPPGAMEAAVLVPLVDAGSELLVVLTRRRDDLRRHAGEFSFPGGRRDPGEVDLIATALRETREEVGIPEADVKILGALQPTATIATEFSIHPFVGVVPGGVAHVAEEAEVAEVLEVPLDDLLAGRSRTRLSRRDVSFTTDVYPLAGRFVWGATARILGDLAERLSHAD